MLFNDVRGFWASEQTFMRCADKKVSRALGIVSVPNSQAMNDKEVINDCKGKTLSIIKRSG